MNEKREEGQFYAHARDLRRIERSLDRMVHQLREEAKESSEREVNRAREEGKLATQVDHLQKSVAEVRTMMENHVREDHVPMMETGPGVPRPELAQARKEALNAETVERKARTALWQKVAGLVTAGGIGAAIAAALK